MTETKEKFYPLMSDTVSKYIFKNPKTRKFYEKLILDLIGIDIRGYKLIDTELQSGSVIKDYRL